jgi:hypothetical protein
MTTRAIDHMKHPDSTKLWQSLARQHTLFWTSSPAEEERDFRLARFGHVVSIILLALISSIELVFLLALIWYLVK